MKKSLFFLLINLIVLSSLGQVNFGIKGGGLYSTNIIKSDSPFEPQLNEWRKYKIGFNIGICSEINLSKRFFLSPSILLTRKGYRYVVNDDKANVNFTYINLPILLGIKAHKYAHILAGLESGIKLSAKQISSDGSSMDYEHNNNWDIAANIGLGSNITPKLFLEFNYTYGFTSINKVYYFTDAQGRNTDRVEEQNRAFQFTLGYYFTK